MINHLDRDASGSRLVEKTRGVAVKSLPRVGINFSFKCSLERIVGIVCTKKVGMADEENFAAVVRVDKPAGDSLCAIAADFARAGIENVYTVDLHPQSIVLFW